jgi:polyphosphate glucokinase
MKVLVVDVGGTHVKILATGQKQSREFPSGPTLTARQMVAGVKKLAADWKYDAVSIGYPGPVINNRPLADPRYLGGGWMGCDFEAAFQRPVKVVNDAAMQALGSYRGGKMLFLGLGTGLGSTMIVNGIVEPMELGHLPYKLHTFEDYVGVRGLERLGKKTWRRNVADVVGRLIAALEPDDVVIGGGNTKKLKELPKGCRTGDNANAFRGGFRLWEKTDRRRASISGRTRSASLHKRKRSKEDDQKNRAAH